jgi:hypothetical protein
MFDHLEKGHDAIIRVREKVVEVEPKEAEPDTGPGEQHPPSASIKYEEKVHWFILEARCESLTKPINEQPASDKAKAKEGRVEDAADKKVVEINFMERDTLKEIIRFMYYDEATLNRKNAFDIMRFSRNHKMEKLCQLCQRKIQGNITVETVCGILERSICYEEEELREECKAFISAHAKEVISHPTFLEVNEVTLDDICSIDYMNVTELTLFSRCVEWARHKSTHDKGRSDAKGQEGLKGEELKEKLKLPMEKKRFRFPTMTITEFNQSVVPLAILTEEEAVEVYNYLAWPNPNKPEIRFTSTPRNETKRQIKKTTTAKRNM